MFTYSRFIELLLKGHGHKYIKRIPYMTPKGRRYRYIYSVTHSHQGKHAMDESHLVEGTKFMVHTESGKEVHAHIKSVNGNKVTYVLDDGPNKGKEVTKTRSEIVSMLNDTHGVDDKVNAKREQLRTQIEQARKTGTEKQVKRLEERLKRLGGEPAKQEEPTETKKTSISAQDFDDLKTGDRIKIKHRGDFSGDQEFEYEVGREEKVKFQSWRSSKDLYRVVDGKAKKQGVALTELRKQKNGLITMVRAEESLEILKYTPPQKPKTPTKKTPTKKTPAKVDYEKTFKKAPKALPKDESRGIIDTLKGNEVFEDQNDEVFFNTIIEMLDIKQRQKSDLMDLVEEYSEFHYGGFSDHNEFKYILDTVDRSYFAVSRFIAKQEAFNTRAKKIKQGTVVEYPFKELHEKGLGFGFIRDAKTKKTGLGFFVKSGMFQGNAFIMTECSKDNALSNLSMILQRLEPTLDRRVDKNKSVAPFNFLKSVDSFGQLSNQLKEISLIVDDGGAFDDEIMRNELVRDYGEEWVEQVEDDARTANALHGGKGEDFDEQILHMNNDQRDAEKALKFAKQMNVIAPIYSDIRRHLNETMGSDVQDDDISSLIRNKDERIAEYLNKAKAALETELKKR